MKIPESELIINGDGSVFHIHIRPDQLADNVILVGDPGRVEMFVPLLDQVEARGASREFVWVTGRCGGKRFTVLSTGIGTDNIDIVMTELDALANIDFQTREVKPEHRTLNILRIGTCGAIQPEIPLGAFIFSHISIGCDGLMNWYEGRDEIALLDFEEAFKKHVHWNRHLPDPYFVRASDKLIRKFEDCTVKGMTISASGFYGPQGRVVRQKLAMPDMLSRDAVEAYAATMNFLCERYSTEEHGRIHHWIVHNEIQAGYYWTNAGERTIQTYMNLYERSMRLVQTIARQYDPNAKALISLDHGWTYRGSDRAYAGKDLLEQLLKYSRQEGDFDWGIAFHPYPQDINNPRTWLDDQATYSYSTPYITPKNLEVLDAWASLPSVCYNGTEPREIQFSEQGINSPDYEPLSLTNQAAGLAWSLAKLQHLDNVITYAYHLWADAHEEGGLRLGLRKYGDDPEDPHGKKPSWDVFRAFGQPDWEEVSTPYLDVIGIGSWDEVVYKGEISE